MSDMPCKYLGVPISASRLTSMDGQILVDKITIITKIKLWSSIRLLNAPIITLIDSALLGVVTFGLKSLC